MLKLLQKSCDYIQKRFSVKFYTTSVETKPDRRQPREVF